MVQLLRDVFPVFVVLVRGTVTSCLEVHVDAT